MRVFLMIFCLFSGAISVAQSNSITGKLIDIEYNNEPLAFANVFIKGTEKGVISDIDGLYSLENIAPGTYTIVYSFVGYKTVELPNVEIVANKEMIIDVPMEPSAAALDEVVIKTVARRESEVSLLLDRKNAVEVRQAIGAEELSKKGISNVSAAVAKTVGITKQEGSNSIYVRGLGDRYNSTSINNLPVPSNDPEKKNIELDIFTTDIVEHISIDKVYGNHIGGDFAGGNVNIVSKDYTGSGFLKLEVGSSVNSNAFSQNNFILQPGSDYFGFKTAEMPNTLGSFAFGNKMNPESKTPVANSFSLSGGDSYNIGDEGRFSYFLTANYGNSYSYISGFSKNVNAQGYSRKDFEDYKKYDFSTNTTAMANLGYRINSNHRLSYNYILINSSSQSLEDYQGYLEDVAPDAYLRRSSFTKNTLNIHQLLGNHTLSEGLSLDWGLAYNSITGEMPDRIQNTLNRRSDNEYYFATNSLGDNHRYFHSLKENSLAANLNLSYQWGGNEDLDYRSKATFGYSGLVKDRTFETTQFNFAIRRNQAVDINNLDAFFNQANLDNGSFGISTFRGTSDVPNALDPQVYGGDQKVHAVFLSYEYHFNEKLVALLGIRAETLSQGVDWQTQLDPVGGSDKFEEIPFLPSLVMRYAVNDKNNFRLGMSKTYTLPQFKERALFIYEDVTEVKIGNPDLYPSDNYNLDLVWEYFASDGEIIGLTGFGKYIIDPINEVTIASATNDISYVNAGDWGYVAGLEFELRKNIFTLNNGDQRFSAGLNAAYMVTKQELNPEKIRKETRYNVLFNDGEDGFSGASDFLLNADVSYLHQWNNNDSNLMATVAYSHFSDRIYALGTNGSGNLVDKGLGTLDVVLKAGLSKNLFLGAKVGNILDSKVERIQQNPTQDYTVLSYRKGINFNLNINYQF